MTTYVMFCPVCEQTNEIKQSMKDPLPEHCPDCGSGAYKQMIQPQTVLFKGEGWNDMIQKGKYHE